MPEINNTNKMTKKEKVEVERYNAFSTNTFGKKTEKSLNVLERKLRQTSTGHKYFSQKNDRVEIDNSCCPPQDIIRGFAKSVIETSASMSFGVRKTEKYEKTFLNSVNEIDAEHIKSCVSCQRKVASIVLEVGELRKQKKEAELRRLREFNRED